MIWQSWADFWAMGGRGGFVWGSYGMCFLLLLVELVLLRRHRTEAFKRLFRLQQMEGGSKAQEGS